MHKFLPLLFGFIILLSCQSETKKQSYSPEQIDSLKNNFSVHLSQIEQEFKTEDWSPLTAEDKASFTHLNYYFYDISWRYEGPLHLYKTPDSLAIQGSKEGDIRPAIKYGYFEFEKNEQKHQLQIIKIFPRRPGGKAHLFLGFWDETSDLETYGGGRYIDIKENEQNFYTVDFNYAYNPYCAYSARYSCAVPPFENRLSLAVEVGEKKFKESH